MFAETYADQNERDYAALREAVKAGRVIAERARRRNVARFARDTARAGPFTRVKGDNPPLSLPPGRARSWDEEEIRRVSDVGDRA